MKRGRKNDQEQEVMDLRIPVVLKEIAEDVAHQSGVLSRNDVIILAVSTDIEG